MQTRCMSQPKSRSVVRFRFRDMVLPAGTYTFQQEGANSESVLVQIFNADRGVVYATLQTVSAERRETTGDAAITLAEQETGKPDLFVKWFYPGRTIGHEFVYPKQQEQELLRLSTKRAFRSYAQHTGWC